MDELEENQEIRDEVNQLKEQVAKMMEMLLAMQKDRSTEERPQASNEEPTTTISQPQGFIPRLPGLNYQGIMVPNAVYPTQPPVTHLRGSHIPPYAPYGLPSGYMPPITTGFQHDTSNLQNPAQTQAFHPNTQLNSPFSRPFPFIPPHGLPLGYQPPQTNNLQGYTNPPVTSSPIPHNTTSHQTQAAHGTFPVYMPRVFPHQMANKTPISFTSESSQSRERFEILEARLRAIEGGDRYGLRDAAELCLVPNVIIPPKFKVSEFDKYDGTTCLKTHLIMYVRKMASCANNDKLLIHFFQDSLTGAALNWYMRLERAYIRCFKDLADAFLKQYKYNIDTAPNRLQLQHMAKKNHENFKEYAQRWRELVTQVKPSLSEKEMVTVFINTLQSPFYDMMIGSISSNFSDLVIIGERVESGMRSGKLIEGPNGAVSMEKVASEADTHNS